MSEQSVYRLEQEVAAARTKLRDDLSLLTSGDTYADFAEDVKDEVRGVRDDYIADAKDSIRTAIDDVIENVKARAAANPAAALAIGAGIAWRLFQKPPVATALIGVGLLGLLKSQPAESLDGYPPDYIAHAKHRLREQAGDFAATVKEDATLYAGVARDKAVELATSAGEAASHAASDFAHAAKEKASGFAASASSAIGHAATAGMDAASQAATDLRTAGDEWTKPARDLAADAVGSAGNTVGMIAASGRDYGHSAIDAAGHIASDLRHAGEEWARPVQAFARDADLRDKVLLGAAGLAIVAALGIASQRHH